MYVLAMPLLMHTRPKLVQHIAVTCNPTSINTITHFFKSLNEEVNVQVLTRPLTSTPPVCIQYNIVGVNK